jgi:hypothetical protein
MSGLLYHRAEPESKKDSYVEFDALDFNINVGEGRVLVKNSVRLLADLQVRDNGARSATDITFDPRCGAHAFIDSVQVAFLEGPMAGQKENINNYARYVAMLQTATKCPEDSLNASDVCELKGFNVETTTLYSKGRVTRNSGTKLTNDQDFSLKPVCALNKMSGGDLPYSKSGTIRLTCNLAPNRSALMGAAYNQAQDDYQLSNVRVTYQSLPDMGKNQQSIMRTVYNIKNSIQSSFANVQARVPIVADSVSVSVQQQQREQTSPFSNYLSESPPGLKSVQFLFNDSTNEYITYKIEDRTEILQRYIDSFIDTGHNGVSIDRLNSNQSFGMGLSFNGYVDLSNQKFSVQIDSAIDNTQPYNVYLYFHGIIAM